MQQHKQQLTEKTINNKKRNITQNYNNKTKPKITTKKNMFTFFVLKNKHKHNNNTYIYTQKTNQTIYKKN